MLAQLNSPSSPLPRVFSVPSAISLLRKACANPTTNSKLPENTTVSNPVSTTLDAASRISPLFATLTKNTGGGGSASSASLDSAVASPTVHRCPSTSFFSHSSALFCTSQNANPNFFSIFSTLYVRRPDGGTPSHCNHSVPLRDSPAANCRLWPVSFLLLPSPPHPGATHA
jgi:hypothetical protein